MLAICGLGNPGKKYMKTRHNIGFVLIDQVVKKYNFTFLKKDSKKELYKGLINKKNCILIKPLTFMNLSGLSVLETLTFYKIKTTNLYVIHDDLDLNVAKLKIKIGGGNGGHNGLANIDSLIGNNYNRIRFGIGRPTNKNLVSSYVLKKFIKSEEKLINNKINKITENFELIFSDISLFLTRISERDKISGV